MRVRATLLGCAAALLASGPLHVQAQELRPGWFCGDLKNHFGPFDYRTAPQKVREIVEPYHFPPQVESLRQGKTGALGGDIDYTLRVFPNHPRALAAMERLGRKENTPQPRRATYSVECYFERAIRFQPDDPQPRVLYASYLVRNKRNPEAVRQLEVVEKLAPKDTSVIYNLGLVYADLGNYEKARSYAHKAYAAGIDVPGLRQKLQRAGQWRDAPG